MNNNQKGFGVVVALVIIIIVGLVGFGGWYVWQSRDDSKSQQSSSERQEPSKAEAQADPYDGWKEECEVSVRACYKRPADWIVSQYGGLQNPACTAYVSLSGPTVKDGGSGSAYIASIDDVPNEPDLKILGLVLEDKPSYAIYNTSDVTENGLAVGVTQTIAYGNHRFSGKTGEIGFVGTPCANGYAAIETAEQAKAWFETDEAKMVLLILRSFSYQE